MTNKQPKIGYHYHYGYMQREPSHLRVLHFYPRDYDTFDVSAPEKDDNSILDHDDVRPGHAEAYPMILLALQIVEELALKHRTVPIVETKFVSLLESISLKSGKIENTSVYQSKENFMR